MKGAVCYLNIPTPIAMVVSAKLATLHELDTVYSLEDMWDMLEVIAVDSHNSNLRESYGNSH